MVLKDFTNGNVLGASELDGNFKNSFYGFLGNTEETTVYIASNAGVVGVMSGGTAWSNYGSTGSVQYATVSTDFTLTSGFPNRFNKTSNFTTAFPVCDYELMYRRDDCTNIANWTGEDGTTGGYIYVNSAGIMYSTVKDYFQSTKKVTVLWSANRGVDGTYVHAGIYITNGTQKVKVSTDFTKTSGTGEIKGLVEIYFNGTDNTCYVVDKGTGSLTEVDISSVTTNWYIGCEVTAGTPNLEGRVYEIFDTDATLSSTVQSKFETLLADGSAWQAQENITLEGVNTLTTPGKYGRLELSSTISANECIIVRKGGFIMD